MNKVTSYLKNLEKSIVYATVDVTTKELVPEIGDFMSTNSEVLKSTYEFTKDLKKSFKKTSVQVKKSKLYTEIEKGFNNALSDLKTGKIYNKERELSSYDDAADAMMGGGDDWDFDFEKELNFDDDFDDDQSAPIDKGDLLVADTVTKSGNASAQMISKAVIASNSAVAKTTMQSTNMLMTQNIQLIAGVRTSIAGVHESINNILKYTTENVSAYINASTEYYAKSYAVMEDNNKILKEMLDIQKKTYSKLYESKEISNKKSSDYENVFSGSSFDIKEYIKVVGKNIKSNDPTGMLSTFGKEGGMQDILGTILSNPLGFVASAFVRQLMPAELVKATTKLSKTFQGLFPTIISKLNKSASDSATGGIWSTLGKILGVQVAPANKKVNPGNYEKGPVPFDGLTRKAIIDVIPEHLSKIESLLSGTNQRTYDFKNGKWINTKEIEKQNTEVYNSYIKNSFSELNADFKLFIKELEKTRALDADNKKRLEDKWFKIQKESYEKGYFNPKDAFKEYDFDPFVKALGEFISNNVATHKLTSVNSDIYSNRDKHANQVASEEASGVSLYNKLQDNSKTDSHLVYDKTYKDVITGINSAISLTSAKDIKGKTVFDYLRDLSVNLSFIRQYGISGSRRGPAIIGKPNMTFEDFNRNFDTDIESKEIKEAREKEQKKNESYDKSNYDSSVNKDEAIATAKFKSAQKTQDVDLEKSYGSWYKSLVERDSKYAEEIEGIEGDTFIDKFSNAKGVKQKYHLISASLTALAKRPAMILTGLVNKADASIHDFLFNKETDETDENGNKIKGFFNATLNKMKEAWTALTTTLERKVIDPIVRKFKLDEKWNNLKEKFKNSNTGTALSGLKNSIKSNLRAGYDWTKNAVGDVMSPITNSNTFKDIKAGYYTGQRESNFKNNIFVKGLANGGIHTGGPKITVTSDNEDVYVVNKNDVKTTKENAKKENSLIKSLQSKFKNIQIDGFANGGTTNEDLMTIDQFIETYNKYNSKNPISLMKVTEAINEGKLKTVDINGVTYIKAVDAEEQIKRDTKKIIDIKNSKTDNGTAFDTFTNDIKNEAKNIVNEVKDKGPGIISKASETINNKINEVLDTDKIKKDKTTLKGKIAKVFGELSGNESDVIAKSVIGGGLGLLTGIVGGPLLGAGIGAGVGIIKHSNFVQKILFGEKTVDDNGKIIDQKGGLINKEIQNTFNKYVPDMAKYGATGAIASLITPFGPFAGAAIGAGIGFAKNSSRMQDMIFGEMGEDGHRKGGLLTEERLAKIKKLYPRAGVGAIAGMALGPFGLLGNAAVGAGVGLLTGTEEFKELIFGEEDENGERFGGIKGVLDEYFVNPLREFGTNFKNDIFGFIQESIIDPLNRAITPITSEISYQAKRIFIGIPKFFVDMVYNKVGPKLSRIFEDRVIGPIAGTVKKLFGGVFDLVKRGISLPFRAVGQIGDHFRRKEIRQGRDISGNAASRLQFASEQEMGDYSYKSVDEFLANNADNEEALTKMASMAGSLAFGTKKLKRNQTKAEKNIDSILGESIGYKFGQNGTTIHKAIKADIKSGDMDKAIARLSQIKTKHGKKLTTDEINSLTEKLTKASREYYIAKGANDNFSADSEKTKEELAKTLGIDVKKLKDIDSKRLFDYVNRELSILNPEAVKSKNDIYSEMPKPLAEINTTLEKQIAAPVKFIADKLGWKPATKTVTENDFQRDVAFGKTIVKKDLKSKMAPISTKLSDIGYEKDDADKVTDILYSDNRLYNLVLYSNSKGINISADDIIKLNDMKLTDDQITIIKQNPYITKLDASTLKKLINKHRSNYANKLGFGWAARNDRISIAGEAAKLGIKIKDADGNEQLISGDYLDKLTGGTKTSRRNSKIRLKYYEKLKDLIGSTVKPDGTVLTQEDILFDDGLTFKELDQICEANNIESPHESKTSIIAGIHNKIDPKVGKGLKYGAKAVGTALGLPIPLIGGALTHATHAFTKGKNGINDAVTGISNLGFINYLSDLGIRSKNNDKLNSIKKVLGFNTDDNGKNYEIKEDENDSNIRYVTSDNGTKKQIRNNQGEWIDDLQDAGTKEAIANEAAEDNKESIIANGIQSIKDKIGSLFDPKEETEEKKESWLSKLFNFVLGGGGSKLLTFGAALAGLVGIGKIAEADPDSPLGRIRDWVGNKLSPIKDWLLNEGEYADEDKGSSGFLNKYVFPALFSGINVIFEKIIPAAITSFISSLPTIIKSALKGVSFLFGYNKYSKDLDTSANNISKISTTSNNGSSSKYKWMTEVSENANKTANNILGISNKVNSSSTADSSSKELKGSDQATFNGAKMYKKDKSGNLVAMTVDEVSKENPEEFYTEKGIKYNYNEETNAYDAENGNTKKSSGIGNLLQNVGNVATKSFLYGRTMPAAKALQWITSLRAPGITIGGKLVNAGAWLSNKFVNGGTKLSEVSANAGKKFMQSFTGKAIEEGAEKVAKEGLEEGVEAVAKKGSSKLLSKIHDVTTPIIEKITAKFDKIFKGSKVVSWISNKLDEIIEFLGIKTKNTVIGKIYDKFVDALRGWLTKALMKVLKKAPEEAAELSAKLLSDATVIIFLIECVWELIQGWDQAESLLGVMNPNILEKFVASITHVLVQELTFGLLDTEVVIDGVIWVLSSIGIETGISKKRKEEADTLKEETTKWATETGHEYNEREYLKRTKSWTGKVSGWVSDKFSGAWNWITGKNKKSEKETSETDDTLSTSNTTSGSGSNTQKKIHQRASANKDTLKNNVTYASNLSNTSDTSEEDIQLLASNTDTMVSGAIENINTNQSLSSLLSNNDLTTGNDLTNGLSKLLNMAIKIPLSPISILSNGLTKAVSSIISVFSTVKKAGQLSTRDKEIIDKSKTGEITPLSPKYWTVNSDLHGISGSLYSFNSLLNKVLNLPVALVSMINDSSTMMKNGVSWIKTKFGLNSTLQRYSPYQMTGAVGQTTNDAVKDIKKAVEEKIESDSANTTTTDNNSNTDSTDGDAGSGTNRNKGFVSQLDPKYSNIRFNKSGDTQYQTLGDTGCAPATAANVLNLYSGNGSLMQNAAKSALQYKDTNSGVRPEYFQNYLGSKGISTQSTTNKVDMMRSISSGRPTILLGRNQKQYKNAKTPYGSSSSHYVLATGTDGKGNVIVQDPEARRPNALYPAKDLINNSHFGMITGRSGRGTIMDNIKSSNYFNSSNLFSGSGRVGSVTEYGRKNPYIEQIPEGPVIRTSGTGKNKKILTPVPTNEQLFSLAKQKYGISQENVIKCLKLITNEGYRYDARLNYLLACTTVNRCIEKPSKELYAYWGGGAASHYVSKMSQKPDSFILDFARVGLYRALSHLDPRAWGCYGGKDGHNVLYNGWDGSGVPIYSTDDGKHTDMTPRTPSDGTTLSGTYYGSSGDNSSYNTSSIDGLSLNNIISSSGSIYDAMSGLAMNYFNSSIVSKIFGTSNSNSSTSSSNTLDVDTTSDEDTSGSGTGTVKSTSYLPEIKNNYTSDRSTSTSNAYKNINKTLSGRSTTKSTSRLPEIKNNYTSTSNVYKNINKTLSGRGTSTKSLSYPANYFSGGASNTSNNSNTLGFNANSKGIQSSISNNNNSNTLGFNPTSKGIQVSNTTINIPSGLGKYHTYMGWQMITSPSSTQYKLRQQAGQKFDSEGFGIIGKKYVIACTTTYGSVGDYVDFYKEDGQIIRCIIGDIKNQSDAGCNKWGHNDGQNIVEFVVDKRSWYSTAYGGNAASMHVNPGNAGCHPEWGGKAITKAINHGSYFTNPSYATIGKSTSTTSSSSSFTDGVASAVSDIVNDSINSVADNTASISTADNSIFATMASLPMKYFKSDFIDKIFGTQQSSISLNTLGIDGTDGVTYDEDGNIVYDASNTGVGDDANKAFYNKYLGKICPTGDQCAMLFQQYQKDVVGMPIALCRPRGGARDNWENFKGMGLDRYFTQIQTSNFDKVKYGDWAVYGDKSGYHGHIGMVVGKHDNGTIDLFGQNQNGGDPPRNAMVLKNFTAPDLGYLRAKQLNGSGTNMESKTKKYLNTINNTIASNKSKFINSTKNNNSQIYSNNSDPGKIRIAQMPSLEADIKDLPPQLGDINNKEISNNSTDKLINAVIEVLNIIANNTSKLSEVVALLSKALNLELTDNDISKLSSDNTKMKNKIANALKNQGSSTGMGNSVMNSSTESLANAMYAIARA